MQNPMGTVMVTKQVSAGQETQYLSVNPHPAQYDRCHKVERCHTPARYPTDLCAGPHASPPLPSRIFPHVSRFLLLHVILHPPLTFVPLVFLRAGHYAPACDNGGPSHPYCAVHPGAPGSRIPQYQSPVLPASPAAAAAPAAAAGRHPIRSAEDHPSAGRTHPHPLSLLIISLNLTVSACVGCLCLRLTEMCTLKVRCAAMQEKREISISVCAKLTTATYSPSRSSTRSPSRSSTRSPCSSRWFSRGRSSTRSLCSSRSSSSSSTTWLPRSSSSRLPSPPRDTNSSRSRFYFPPSRTSHSLAASHLPGSPRAPFPCQPVKDSPFRAPHTVPFPCPRTGSIPGI